MEENNLKLQWSPGKTGSVEHGASPLRSPGRGALASPLHTGFNDVKSSVGEQVDSKKKTAPSATFGSSTRPKTIPQGASVPGPGAYQIPSGLSKSAISTIKSPPASSISGREKFGSTADLKQAANLPGPGDYTSKVVNPRQKSAPEYSLGKKWHASSNGALRSSPGPGSYTQPTTLGKTLLSTQETQPIVKFGKVTRKPLLLTSTADVGPGLYNTGNAAVGNQVSSNFQNSAAYSFSAVGRKKAPIGSRMNHENIPGPGAYKLKPAVGPQVVSTLRSAPKCSMSGRVKFGSHF